MVLILELSDVELNNVRIEFIDVPNDVELNNISDGIGIGTKRFRIK